jgi:DNA polymerase-1
LKTLGPLYLQAPQWDDDLQRIKKEYCSKNKILLDQFTFDLLPMDVLIPYMQRDCIATLRLYHLFKKLANPGTEWIYKKLIEASQVFTDIELAGFAIDMDKLEDIEYLLETELEQATKLFDTVVARVWNPTEYVRDTKSKSWPTKFNVNSPKQLKWLLEKVTNQKLTSTDKETLDSLISAHPVVKALQEVRKKSKLLGTYIYGTRERICRDYRLRGNFNLHGTETGRLSSTNPNMQNIPRSGPIKSMFVAPPGKVILQMDYSQAEVRGLGYLSGDKFLHQMYREGKDIHGEMALQVYGDGWTKEHRNACKSIIFGSIYGRGPSSVAEQVGCTMTEARQLIEKVFSYMSEARQWIQQRRQMGTRGDPCISVFGRRRHFVMVNRDALNHIQNEYINTPVQSLASDLTMFSVIEIARNLPRSSKIISTVHDSIILEVDHDELNEVAQLCADIMSTVPDKFLPNSAMPFKAAAEYGHHWGELKPVW